MYVPKWFFVLLGALIALVFIPIIAGPAMIAFALGIIWARRYPCFWGGIAPAQDSEPVIPAQPDEPQPGSPIPASRPPPANAGQRRQPRHFGSGSDAIPITPRETDEERRLREQDERLARIDAECDAEEAAAAKAKADLAAAQAARVRQAHAEANARTAHATPAPCRQAVAEAVAASDAEAVARQRVYRQRQQAQLAAQQEQHNAASKLRVRVLDEEPKPGDDNRPWDEPEVGEMPGKDYVLPEFPTRVPDPAPAVPAQRSQTA